MSAVPNSFWAEVDQRIAGLPQANHSFTAEVIPLPGTAVACHAAAPCSSEREDEPLCDWTGLLDTLTAAKELARSQEVRLQDQATKHECLIAELRAELRQIQEQVRASEAQVAAVQSQAEASVKEIHQQAEARVEAAQIRADARVRIAEERAQTAQLRADAAENWLKRIERATQDLLPSIKQERAVAIRGRQSS